VRRARGWHQHFVGKLRVNVESIPRLPAAALRLVVDDPRAIPYLFLWQRESSGKVEEGARVAPIGASRTVAAVEIKRWDGSLQRLKILRRPLPQGGMFVLVVCPLCLQARRHLYGWALWDGRSVTRAGWPCRRCGDLRYQSEGTYLPRLFRAWGGYPRPSTWDPWLFASLDDAARWLGSET
jgi:hypothetical protein